MTTETKGRQDAGAPSGEALTGSASVPLAGAARRKSLLADLKRQLKLLEDDIRARLEESGTAALPNDWETARAAGRTALPFAEWREAEIIRACRATPTAR